MTLFYAVFIFLIITIIYRLYIEEKFHRCDILHSAQSGFLRGMLAACLLSSFHVETIIKNGVVFGVVNASMKSMGFG